MALIEALPKSLSDRPLIGMIEANYIAYFRSIGLADVNGTDGGDGGNTGSRRLTDEHKAAVSKALKGKPKSQEHRAKISAGQIGRVPWNKGLKLPDSQKAIQVANMAKGRPKAIHTRYHTNKNIIKDGCTYCESAQLKEVS